MDADDLKKQLDQIDAQILREFDQELQEVRNLYNLLSETERDEFRNWLAQLAEFSENPVKSLPMRVKIQTDNTCLDDEMDYHASALLSPKVMFEAVEAWDKGEEFTPNHTFGIF